ncbi:MAG: hypothetical protein K1X88_05495 [Nannocystaceae bacterium]|nr:hypothetical protein [Nannocystaceae bacterium]
MPRLRLALAPVLVSLACDQAAAPQPQTSPSSSASAPAKADAKTETKADAKAETKADAKAETKADAKADTPAPDGDKPAGTVASLDAAAIFFVRDKGMVVLDAGGFTTIEGSASRYVQAVERAPSGKLFGLSFDGIVPIDGSGIGATISVPGGARAFEIDSKGGMWVLGTEGASFRAEEAATWTTEPVATFGTGEVLLMAIAVDASDQPWVATSDSIFTRTDAGWKRVGSGGRYNFIETALRDPSGRVWIVGNEAGLVTDGKGGVTKAKLPRSGYGSLGDLAFSAKGVGVIQNDLEGVAVFTPAVARYHAPGDFKIGTLSAIAVDDRQRVWVAGDGGVAILGPGDARTVWRSGTQDAIAGQVNFILVQGDGPELPKAGELHKGSISGRIAEGDKGVAGVAVELCESPSMIYSRTPCTGAPTHLRGKTDAEGRFRFDDVPLGAYGVAVKIGRKWQITMGTALGSTMKPGEPVDVGTIEIASK